MVLRFFLLFGVVLLSATGYFIVVQKPPNVQAAPAEAEYERLAAAGILPTGNLSENEEVEHDVFNVPPMDEMMLEQAMEDMANMPGMNMAGMDMSEDGGAMDMDMDGDGVPDMNSSDMGMTMADDDDAAAADSMAGMDMSEDGGAMDMDMDGDGVPDMNSSDMGMTMADGEATALSEEEQEQREVQQMSGLIIDPEGAFDREITLTMSEWSFSDLSVEAKPGERIRFTLRNDGTVLHEFMFMGMAQMQAVSYRNDWADWSLLEHEALYEKSLLLPGQEITFVAEVAKPGAWMFMCMLPYHMQMGMMGQIATPGMAMQM